jgi:tetratricopeptide (TPR) repeat protein
VSHGDDNLFEKHAGSSAQSPRRRSSEVPPRVLTAGEADRPVVAVRSTPRQCARVRWPLIAAAIVVAGALLVVTAFGVGIGRSQSAGEPHLRPQQTVKRLPQHAPRREEVSSRVESQPTYHPADGRRLNDQAFSLMQQGRYTEAVPILRQAVTRFSPSSHDLYYAYALFNLGKSLNRSGNPEQAIPYLERRLTWTDQRETVQAELDLARRRAGWN